ncbi:MAG: tetratricopeptide repeat protein [Bacteroidales bacterium]|nr:tetratricopeptide repeat protein [Bacteroidales bacterium]
MKSTFLTIAAASLFAIACNHTPKELTYDQLRDSIETIDSRFLSAAPTDPVDTAMGNKMLSYCTQFADRFPDDTLAASYLHRAAHIALGMDLIDDMVAYYDRIIDNYPDYERLDECYYEKGIALDNAGRKDQARKAYQDFLDEYPDHFLADDIRKAIPLLDMSDELLLQFLNENSKK